MVQRPSDGPDGSAKAKLRGTVAVLARRHDPHRPARALTGLVSTNPLFRVVAFWWLLPSARIKGRAATALRLRVPLSYVSRMGGAADIRQAHIEWNFGGGGCTICTEAAAIGLTGIRSAPTDDPMDSMALTVLSGGKHTPGWIYSPVRGIFLSAVAVNPYFCGTLQATSSVRLTTDPPVATVGVALTSTPPSLDCVNVS